ncbi:MAG: nucleoside kinase [Candidatus Aureabacteria bacterium]|nr:nucleoside kinase [Candidatus Auribacterota bacterium]
MKRKETEANFEQLERRNIPKMVVQNVLEWNMAHGVDTVGGLNKRVLDGTFPELVREGDAEYVRNVSCAADKIIKHRDLVRIAIIAGPSSSGKTTTTIKLNERLMEAGMSIVPMNLDNYFFNLEMHPKDEFGDYDFEVPEALDLALINEHLAELIKGKTVQTPIYNFKTGKREKKTVPFSLKRNQILLIDSLHGLYEKMTHSVPREMKFRLYIETLSQLKDNEGNWVRWTDTRLLRRMVRDSWHRSYDPVRTIGHWHYVRKSEMRYIVPFITTVDFVLNGALPFELPVHKKFMFPYFAQAIGEFKNNPKLALTKYLESTAPLMYHVSECVL